MKLNKSIELHGVCKTYQGRNFIVEALKEIDLEIENGSYCSIIGKSGCGKSSLLKIVGLLDSDYTGEFTLFGICPRNKKDADISGYRRRIGFVFQDFQLIGRLTVLKNLETTSVIRLGRVDHAKIAEVLSAVEMSDKADSYPDELSGGQKQRVSIARAMLADPQLLIADEPTGAVDEENTQIILSLLDRLHESSAATILVVTHDMDVARRSDRIIQMRDGKIDHDHLFL